mgnify:CR=1 FL=1
MARGRWISTSSPLQTFEIGMKIARSLKPGDIVLLVGPMGSGKTVLASGLARGLGIEEDVQSPSFVIASTYSLPGGVYFHHIDLYRISGEEEMATAGIMDYIGDDSISVVEWGEKLMGFIREYLMVEIEMGRGSRRRMRISGHGERGEELARMVEGIGP